MARSFIDEMKHLVEHPLEWPRRGAVVICVDRFNELLQAFPAPPAEQRVDAIFGLDVRVDESVPPDEIRLMSRLRDGDRYVTQIETRKVN